MEPTIVVIGITCRDTNRQFDGSERRAVGGMAYYMSHALHALGIPIHVITWVADADRDLLVPYVTASIPYTNIPVSRSVTFVNQYLDPSGNTREQSATVPTFSLSLQNLPDDTLVALRQASHVAFAVNVSGIVTDTFLEQLRTTTRATFADDFASFLCRIGPDRILQHAPEWPDRLPYGLLDIAVVSREDAPIDHRDQPPDTIVRTLVQRGLREALVTLGSRGSVLGTADGTYAIAPYPVTPIDPTGAGDTFFAAYLAERSRGKPIRACAQFASAAAALSLTHAGPLTASRDDVRDFMQSSVPQGTRGTPRGTLTTPASTDLVC